MKTQKELKAEAMTIRTEKEYKEKIVDLYKQGLKMDDELINYFSKIIQDVELPYDGINIIR